MKLIAFDQKSIRYAQLKALVELSYFEDHSCSCQYCSFEGMMCPSCQEEIDYLHIDIDDEKYGFASNSVAMCPECDSYFLKSRHEKWRLRQELEDLEKLQPA